MSSYGNPSMGGMAPQPVMRQSPPPRFRPCMIITVVLSLGLLFIGLTLTIIAHWPGYTAIGFNPLEIIGPVLLSLGGVVFIGCIVEVVRRNQSEKENYQRQMEERERMMSYANRTLRAANQQPQMQPYPQGMQLQAPPRGILKSGSGSQYDGGDSGFGQTQNSSAYNTSAFPSTATNLSYQPDAEGGRYEVHGNSYPMELQAPQPPAPQPEVPQPMRTRTKDYKKQATAHQEYSNGAYVQDQSQVDPVTGQVYPTAGQMDPVSGEAYPGQVDPVTGHVIQADVHDQRQMQDYLGEDSFDMYDQPEEMQRGSQDRESKRKRRQQKRRRQAEAVQRASPQQPYHQQQQGGEQPMKINIRANQPGVQVTITPTGTPNMPRHDTPHTDI